MAQPGVAAGRKRADVIADYEGFVKKFEQKRTTDDCMTPPAVYEVVADYVAERYGLDKADFVRPFWPGADYQAFDYKPGQVVVDNPPFSILSKVCAWYEEKGIDFFLFAQTMTLLNTIHRRRAAGIVCRAKIYYSNGAGVNTSFVTSLESGVLMRSDPDLSKRLVASDPTKRTLKLQYEYPPEVVTAARLEIFAGNGIPLTIMRDECSLVSRLDAQTGLADPGNRRKEIYGHGALVSDVVAVSIADALKKCAPEKIVLTLSDREKEIVKSLGGRKDA